MITKLRVSRKDPGALPFKLEGTQHVYQISIKAGDEYIQKRKIRGIMSKESQYPGRKSMSSSHAIEKTRALRENQERINTIQCMKLEHQVKIKSSKAC